MNINPKAIELFESNECDAALDLFKEAVDASRNVQSLTNLAWMYYYEESDPETALELVEEAIGLHPTSHLPSESDDEFVGEAFVAE
ncbi:tetratricopeptide repeat protein [Paenibacillus sp. strain BS8-2]